MDRYETAAHRYLKGKAGVHQMTLDIEVKQLAEHLREHFPDDPQDIVPGRCGECRWWGGCLGWLRHCQHPNHQNMPAGEANTPPDATCPRFEAKPDKYEELAAELLDKLNRRDYGKACMADFLRERVTVRES